MSVSTKLEKLSRKLDAGGRLELKPFRERKESVSLELRALCSDVVATPDLGAVQCDRETNHRDDHSVRIPNRDFVFTWPRRAP